MATPETVISFTAIPTQLRLWYLFGPTDNHPGASLHDEPVVGVLVVDPGYGAEAHPAVCWNNRVRTVKSVFEDQDDFVLVGVYEEGSPPADSWVVDRAQRAGFDWAPSAST